MWPPLDAADAADVPLDRDTFLRPVQGELTGLPEEVVSVEDATGFADAVGRKIGGDADEIYRRALGVERPDRERLPEVLVVLTRRLRGDPDVTEGDDEKFVLASPGTEDADGRTTAHLKQQGPM